MVGLVFLGFLHGGSFWVGAQGQLRPHASRSTMRALAARTTLARAGGRIQYHPARPRALSLP